MTTLTKIIAIGLISCLFLSCNLGKGIDGDGHVVISERTINEPFDAIKISNGLDLQLTQSEAVSLTVEADTNLQDLIETSVENGVLNIYTTENIRRSTLKKVRLSFNSLKTIKATSGSDVWGKNLIQTSQLTLESTSGADIKLEVKTDSLTCTTTSSSDIELSGSTKHFAAKATSGSDIEAAQLISETAAVSVTSGADIEVYASKTLTANATSGGDITYYGNPETVSASDNSAGSIKKH
ncbi:head GIN domain-containing protein [Winogradskyella rapida]|uniref:Head GIN domain-containing protein n=1 Tax=Winogradskyella rapida TaxID=549701 RepID=A0ABW3KQV4_9FLAO